METDEPYDPLHRGALGVHGAVVVTEDLSDFIRAFGLWISRRGRPIILSRRCPQMLITGIGQNCPKSNPISHYQGEMASESMVRPSLLMKSFV
jgi:hypothetical protein